MSEQPTLASTRLILRPFDAADAPAVQAIAGAREIADTTLSIPHPYPDGAAAAWIGTHQAAWQAGTAVTYAITRRDTGTVVGAIGLGIEAAHASAEMGYWVAVPHWNQGYCTEAARLLMDFAFGPLRLHRIQARHLTRNPASGRVMQKLGMRLEGVARDAVLKWGQFEDLAVYAMLTSDSGGDSNWAEAASCTWLHEAQLLVSVLEAAGIVATMPNEHTLGVAPFYGNLVGGVRVMVPSGDLTRARDVLAATRSEPERGDHDDAV